MSICVLLSIATKAQPFVEDIISLSANAAFSVYSADLDDDGVTYTMSNTTALDTSMDAMDNDRIVRLHLAINCRRVGNTLFVDSTSNAGAGSLREAVACSNPGDTIRFNPNLIASGSDTIVLASQIDIPHDLVFIGLIQDSMTRLVISGDNSVRIFNVGYSGDQLLVLDSMTLVNGFSNNPGGAINVFFTDSSKVIITNSMLCGNAAESGGAISMSDVDLIIGPSPRSTNSSSSTLEISNSTLSDNSADDAGGAIYSSSCSPTIRANHSTLNNNTATGGGAIYNVERESSGPFVRSSTSSSSSTYVSHSTLSNNSAMYEGGAIYSSTAIGCIDSSVMHHNTADRGGAIYFTPPSELFLRSSTTDSTDLTIQRSTFTNNSATTTGGAIYSTSSSIAIDSSTINDNEADYGGAIYILDSEEGALFSRSANSSSSATRICYSTLNGNTAEVDGGAIYYGPYIFSGPFARSTSSSTSSQAIYVSHSTLSGNIAEGNGGFVFTTTSITIDSCTISGNSAEIGGAIYYEESEDFGPFFRSTSTNSATICVNRSVVNGNTADYEGGAIFSIASVTIDSSTISNNNALTGGAIYVSKAEEGGLAARSSSASASYVNVSYSTFSGNSASGDGGALYYSSTPGGGALARSATSDSSEIIICFSTITDNSAQSGGAIYCNLAEDSGPLLRAAATDSSAIYISYSTLSGNTASVEGGAIYINTDDGGGSGGPFFRSASSDSSEITLRSSIVALNGGDNIAYSSQSPMICSKGYNIFSDTALAGSIATDQLAIDSAMLNLDTLTDNGGPTQTLLPLAGSVAVDRGDPSDTSDAQNGSIVGIRDVGAAESSIIPIDTTVCDEITLGGTNYDTSGMVIVGDTVYNLTVNHSSFDTVMMTICDTFFTPSGRGILATGTFHDTIPNVVGCDSVITYELIYPTRRVGNTLFTDSTADEGPGSLRAAVACSRPNDTIRFNPNLIASGSDTIVLASQIDIPHDLVFIGLIQDSMTRLVISGNDAVRIFNATYAGDHFLVFDSMTLVDGNVPIGIEHGGAIQSTTDDTSSLVITNSSFSGNHANNWGGAIASRSYSQSSFVNISNSTFSNNSSGDLAGAVYSNGARMSSTINIHNSTFVDNTSDRGGALRSFSSPNASDPNTISTVNVTNSTFLNNFANDGRTIFVASNNPEVNLTSSIIQSNRDSNILINDSIFVNSLGYNIFSDSALTGSVATDQLGVDSAMLNLGSLDYNGGPTQTLLPLIGSVAVNHGNPADMSNAQNGPIVSIRDVGAAESSIIDTMVCDSVVLGGMRFDSSGLVVVGDTIYDLVVLSSSFDTIMMTLCDTFFTPSGRGILATGTFHDTIPNAVGCDSVITFMLEIGPAPELTLGPTTCENDSFSMAISGADSIAVSAGQVIGDSMIVGMPANSVVVIESFVDGGCIRMDTVVTGDGCPTNCILPGLATGEVYCEDGMSYTVPYQLASGVVATIIYQGSGTLDSIGQRITGIPIGEATTIIASTNVADSACFQQVTLSSPVACDSTPQCTDVGSTSITSGSCSADGSGTYEVTLLYRDGIDVQLIGNGDLNSDSTMVTAIPIGETVEVVFSLAGCDSDTVQSVSPDNCPECSEPVVSFGPMVCEGDSFSIAVSGADSISSTAGTVQGDTLVSGIPANFLVEITSYAVGGCSRSDLISTGLGCPEDCDAPGLVLVSTRCEGANTYVVNYDLAVGLDGAPVATLIYSGSGTLIDSLQRIVGIPIGESTTLVASSDFSDPLCQEILEVSSPEGCSATPTCDDVASGRVYGEMCDGDLDPTYEVFIDYRAGLTVDIIGNGQLNSDSTKVIGIPSGETVQVVFSLNGCESDTAQSTSPDICPPCITPVLVCSPDTILYGCDTSVASASLFYPTVATDTSSISRIDSIWYVEEVYLSSCVDSIYRTWFVRDSCNQMDTCSHSLVVIDSMAPMISCLSDTVLRGCDTSVASANIFLPTSMSDDCGIDSVWFSETITVVSPIKDSIHRTWFVRDSCQNIGSCSQSLIILDTVLMDLKVLLEGAYVTTDSMTTTLNEYHLLPGQDPGLSDDFLTQTLGVATSIGHPYTIDPWFYLGTEGDPYGDSTTNPSADLIPYDEDVVDWLLVSVREGGPETTNTTWTGVALLKSDGSVTFARDCPCAGLSDSTDYYVVIEHRNHLAVMSEAQQTIDRAVAVDFSVHPGRTILNLPFESTQALKNGQYMMYTGNPVQHLGRTDINAVDLSSGVAPNFGMIRMYIQSDTNLDGDVGVADYLMVSSNFAVVNFLF